MTLGILSHMTMVMSFWGFFSGKARRLKQAKDEATEEIEKYRVEREQQFKDFEAKHVGSREGVANKIEADTRLKIDDMNRTVQNHKERVIQEILTHIYNIEPEMHKNFKNSAK